MSELNNLSIDGYAVVIEGQFQGMDSSSGGYPYPVTDPRSVKLSG